MSRLQRPIVMRIGLICIPALMGSGASSLAAPTSSSAHKISTGTLSTLPIIPPVISCTTLAPHDFGSAPDAPTSLSSATIVAATSTTPEYCDVKGYISPQTRFELNKINDLFNAPEGAS